MTGETGLFEGTGVGTGMAACGGGDIDAALRPAGAREEGGGRVEISLSFSGTDDEAMV